MNSETERQGTRPDWTPSKDPCADCGTTHQVAIYKYSRMAQTKHGEALVCCSIDLCPACARSRSVKEKQGGLKGNPWL